MEKTNFSPMQLAIFNHIESQVRNLYGRMPATNLVVGAKAGTGKTYTMVSECQRLMECFPAIRKFDIAFMAFNKSISNEIDQKAIEWQKAAEENGWSVDEDGTIRNYGIPKDGYYVDEDGYIRDDEDKRIPIKTMGDISEVFTTHKFGMRCINRYLRYVNAGFMLTKENVDGNDAKYIKAAKALIPANADISKADRNKMASTANRIFNMCRINLIKAGDIDAMKRIIAHYDMTASEQEIWLANQLMINYAYKVDLVSCPIINYTDMLIYPLVLHKQFEQTKPRGCKHSVIPYYRVVFCDECQDLNNAQRHLMSTAARLGMFVAVGDPNQAINGFAGANNDSFDLIARLPRTKMLPLSVNYRCGKNIIKLAQGIVPEITAHDGAIDGIVRRINTIDLDTFQEGHNEEIVDEETGEVKQEYVDGDMILCRTTAPLVSMCIKLIAHGKAAQVMGRDIVKSIEMLVERSETKTIKGFKTWAEQEKERVKKEQMKARDCNESDAEKTPEYVTLCDKVDCILAFEDRETNLDYILKELNAIFAGERAKGAITFCTCHKSKGLENDRVFILTPDKLPLEWKGQLDWQYQQEVNLEYVAYTRAKKELVFVDIEQSRLLEIDFNEK